MTNLIEVDPHLITDPHQGLELIFAVKKNIIDTETISPMGN